MPALRSYPPVSVFVHVFVRVCTGVGRNRAVRRSDYVRCSLRLTQMVTVT